jgi:cellulose synthase (UDP-forming)
VYLLVPVVYLGFAVLPVKAFSLTFLAFFAPYFVLSELLAFIVGYGLKTWRSRQYGLALFPIWIKSTVNAARNVWFGHELPFVVTPKTQQAVAGRFPARLIWPQLTMMGLLVLAVAVGVVRLLTGDTITVIGFAVTTFWVAYNLTAMSVVNRAGLYRAPPRDSTEVVT